MKVIRLFSHRMEVSAVLASFREKRTGDGNVFSGESRKESGGVFKEGL